MNRCIVVIMLALAAVSSSVAHAGIPLRTLTWAGELRDGAGPVNRLVSALFVVKDGATTVSQIEEASFDVTEGNIVIDLFVSDAPGLTLEVFINGEALGSAPLRTGWPAAAFVDAAGAADLADSAGSVGGVAVPLTKSALATAGQAPFPIGNVVGFPTPFLDGDQGLAFVPDTANFTFTNGVLGLKDNSITSTQLSSIAAIDLAPSAVTNVKIGDKSITDSDFGATLGFDKVAPDAITAKHIGAASTKTVLYRVVEPGCSVPVNTLMLSPTCRFTNVGSCTAAGGFPGKLTCDGTFCSVSSTSDCANEVAGALVFK